MTRADDNASALDFERRARALAGGLADLLVAKQRQYGDAHTRAAAMMRVLYPEGIMPGGYETALLEFRACEKLARGTIATDPDIAGYNMLAMAGSDERAQK